MDGVQLKSRQQRADNLQERRLSLICEGTGASEKTVDAETAGRSLCGLSPAQHLLNLFNEGGRTFMQAHCTAVLRAVSHLHGSQDEFCKCRLTVPMLTQHFGSSLRSECSFLETVSPPFRCVQIHWGG